MSCIPLIARTAVATTGKEGVHGDSLTTPEERSAILDTLGSGVVVCRTSRITEVSRETHDDE
jgi:hypothetical protein